MTLEQAWARQIAWCDGNGSPFTARVLEAAWADRQRGGALAGLLPDWPGDAGVDAVPLRVAGALHALALSGRDAALAALYASFDTGPLPEAVAGAIDRQRDVVAAYLGVAPQTNEIGRSAALLGGFATVARATGLPLATFEIGASAGLNQLWHRFRYALGDKSWGEPDGPVLIRAEWQGAAPALSDRIDVDSQAACDVAPIDLQADGAALRLLSYVWPDQTERLERLRAAIALAQRLGVRVEQADALPWVRRALAAPRAGVATVLYHSVMWQYMPETTRDALRAAIEAAGARATPAAPLAWLAFEPPNADAQMLLRLRLWPGGEPRVLADAHPHGRWVRWRS
ncbi:MAG TPA: DUF2332 family protein [Burkholderiaceae bacterium]|nr:DUF2332 family protein [Burkholderiaceae bacterium]